MKTVLLFASVLLPLAMCAQAAGQAYGKPDRGEPGDEMIQAYLAREAIALEKSFLEGIKTLEDWQKRLPEYQQQYYYMLGLWPLPEKTPLEPRITGTLKRDGYVVEKLHFQSRPRLYVTGNLYRPAEIKPGEKLPTVLYVCGHSNQGRNGNKTAFQSHGIWFAKHGYVCLVIDTLQLGEIAGIHHGTYRENRWWWHSRGYTPAGVEAWNGVRAIDYLCSRPEVDPQRIAVTGISGGGAATFWIAAADQRVAVAVPVSGMADYESQVANRVINGHCDCMFLHNTFQWSNTMIAALIAPRPMLFTNSDQDPIFPMDANERVINRLERVYSLFGRSDMVDAMVSIGGHAYRKDLRQAIYRFINIHLKSDPRIVEDSEEDLVTGRGKETVYPIPIEELRVFPTDDDLPKDQLNSTIDQYFVPMARVEPPKPGQFAQWKHQLLAELRRVSFRPLPQRVQPAKLAQQVADNDLRLESESGIVVRLQTAAEFKVPEEPKRILLAVRNADQQQPLPQLARSVHQPGDVVYLLAPRGVDTSRWTRRNPPNYVERSHALLGRTVDGGRVWDIIAAARYLRAKHDGKLPVFVLGEGPAAVLAAYAALWEEDIEGVVLGNPPLGHMEDGAPQFLNVLRVCDVPDVLGMLAPKHLEIHGVAAAKLEKVASCYAAADAQKKLVIAQ